MLLKDIMTKRAITVSPEMSVMEAAEVIYKHNFDGLPVVDKSNIVVGIITQYDLLTKGTVIHLPTFQKLFDQLKINEKGGALSKNDLRKIENMKVQDVMNNNPLVLNQDAGVDEVITAFSEHHRVNPIPVVDSSNKLVGVVSRFDITKLFLKASQKLKEKL